MAATPKPVRKAIKKEYNVMKSREDAENIPRHKGLAKEQKKSMTEYAKGKSKKEHQAMMSHFGKISKPKKRRSSI